MRAALALLHGYGEHAGRYAHVRAVLEAHGIALIARDLLGHGQRKEPRGAIRRFTDYHVDVEATVAEAMERADGAPVFLLGHSMGGLLACHWMLAEQRPAIAGLVLSSPFLGLAIKVNPLKLLLGRALSRLAPSVSLPSELRTEDICTDPDIRIATDMDPLNHRVANARWFTETMTAMDSVHARAGHICVPTLLMYAGSDRIADPLATASFARALGAPDLQVRCFEQAAHEIFNEPPAAREQVFETLLDWLALRSAT